MEVPFALVARGSGLPVEVLRDVYVACGSNLELSLQKLAAVTGGGGGSGSGGACGGSGGGRAPPSKPAATPRCEPSATTGTHRPPVAPAPPASGKGKPSSGTMASTGAGGGAARSVVGGSGAGGRTGANGGGAGSGVVGRAHSSGPDGGKGRAPPAASGRPGSSTREDHGTWFIDDDDEREVGTGPAGRGRATARGPPPSPLRGGAGAYCCWAHGEVA